MRSFVIRLVFRNENNARKGMQRDIFIYKQGELLEKEACRTHRSKRQPSRGDKGTQFCLSINCGLQLRDAIATSTKCYSGKEREKEK